MFINVFKSEIIRCFSIKKIVLTLIVFVAVLLFGQAEIIKTNCLAFSYEQSSGAVEILGNALSFDKFKIVLVILLASLHTNSFCKDDNTHYLRMILNRTNIVYYTQARFITNMLFIILLSILGFVLATLILLAFCPIASITIEYDCYYKILANDFPVLYIMLMGFQLGILAAAFSSIGLTFSSFQSNAFVSIGITGLIFFLAASYIPGQSVFSVLAIISMSPSFIKSFDASQVLNLSWSILYPVLVIVICGYIFYRRLDCRMESGDV